MYNILVAVVKKLKFLHGFTQTIFFARGYKIKRCLLNAILHILATKKYMVWQKNIWFKGETTENEEMRGSESQEFSFDSRNPSDTLKTTGTSSGVIISTRMPSYSILNSNFLEAIP